MNARIERYSLLKLKKFLKEKAYQLNDFLCCSLLEQRSKGENKNIKVFEHIKVSFQLT